MSLYNMLCGTDGYMDVALRVAGLEDKNVGRLRDAYFVMEDDDIIVAVFTRNGGGNRECDRFYCDYKYSCYDCYYKGKNKYIKDEDEDEEEEEDEDEEDEEEDDEDEKEDRSEKLCQGCIITHAEEIFSNFIRDEDDDCDCTYATMYFSILPEYEEEVDELVKEHLDLLDHESFGDRFEKIMEAIRK